MSEVENLFDEEILKSNVSGAAYFILLYEHFEDTVITTVKEFYSNICAIDGKLYSDIDDEYIRVLKERVANHEDNPEIPYERLLNKAERDKETYDKDIIAPYKGKNIDGKRFRGSLNWLTRHDVFSDDDISRILIIRKHRNDIVHELLHILCEGLTAEDAKMISELLAFNNRINKWRFREIDMPAQGIKLPDGADIDDVMGGDDAVLTGIFRILFCNEGEQFKKALESVKNNETPIQTPEISSRGSEGGR